MPSAAVDMCSIAEKAMNRRLVMALIGGTALVAATGVLIATAQPRGVVFIAGDQPVTEAQVREKLQSDGYSNIQIVPKATCSRPLDRRTGRPARSWSMRERGASPRTTMTTKAVLTIQILPRDPRAIPKYLARCISYNAIAWRASMESAWKPSLKSSPSLRTSPNI